MKKAIGMLLIGIMSILVLATVSALSESTWTCDGKFKVLQENEKAKKLFCVNGCSEGKCVSRYQNWAKIKHNENLKSPTVFEGWEKHRPISVIRAPTKVTTINRAKYATNSVSTCDGKFKIITENDRIKRFICPRGCVEGKCVSAI